MLAVNSRPRFRRHAGGQPEPEPEKMHNSGVNVERAMGRMTVQINGHRGDGDMGHRQCHHYVAPPRQYNEPVRPAWQIYKPVHIHAGNLIKSERYSSNCTGRARSRKVIFVTISRRYAEWLVGSKFDRNGLIYAPYRRSLARPGCGNT